MWKGDRGPGVTFKPNTDDMRDAPSLVVIPMLQERGASIRAYDPQGRKYAESLLPGVEWCSNAIEAATSADIVVVLTEWNEFRALNLGALREVSARRRPGRPPQYLPTAGSNR